jgi:hypothetical protein
VYAPNYVCVSSYSVIIYGIDVHYIECHIFRPSLLMKFLYSITFCVVLLA